MRPHILILNGPAGVGKSTVARSLARLVPGTVCIAGDDIRAIAPANARSSLGPRSTYRAGAALADAYLRMGAGRVIFEYVFESPAHVETFRRAAPDVPVLVFTLWAPLEVIRSREERRPGRRAMGARVEECFRALEANLGKLGTVVSTLDCSADRVADAVNALADHELARYV